MGTLDEEKTGEVAASPADSAKLGVASRVVEIDPGEEKALVRKIDVHIVPFMVALYLFSFLDRGV